MELFYNSSPTVEFATNRFTNVPVILKYDEHNIIEVVNVVDFGFTQQASIYHSDGTYIAKVTGNRIYKTKEGEKADIKLDVLRGVTELSLDGRTLMELRQLEGDSFKTTAELYLPDGEFIRVSDSGLHNIASNEPLRANGITFTNNSFSNLSIAVHMRSDGSFSIGV